MNWYKRAILEEVSEIEGEEDDFSNIPKEELNIPSLNQDEYYHGTGMEFDTLSLNSHSAKHPILFLTKDYDVAESYSRKGNDYNSNYKRPIIYKVKLNSKKMFNPFDDIGMLERDGVFDFAGTVVQFGVNPSPNDRTITEDDIETGEWTLFTEEFIAFLKNKGYDSAKVYEGYFAKQGESPKTDYSYAVFYNNIIKVIGEVPLPPDWD